MLLHKYSCAVWFGLELKRCSKSFEKFICLILFTKEKEKLISSLFWSVDHFRPAAVRWPKATNGLLLLARPSGTVVLLGPLLSLPAQFSPMRSAAVFPCLAVILDPQGQRLLSPCSWPSRALLAIPRNRCREFMLTPYISPAQATATSFPALISRAASL